MFTWTIGAIGAAASYWVGSRYFGFTLLDTVVQVVVANLAAFAGGLLTLQAEKVRWIKKTLIPDGVRTWALLTILYCGIQLAIVPTLRELPVFAALFVPLLMSTGLNFIWAFGPAQDFLVRRAQRKMRRERVVSSSGQKA